jgi:hypothetical protein
MPPADAWLPFSSYDTYGYDEHTAADGAYNLMLPYNSTLNDVPSD